MESVAIFEAEYNSKISADVLLMETVFVESAARRGSPTFVVLNTEDRCQPLARLFLPRHGFAVTAPPVVLGSIKGPSLISIKGPSLINLKYCAAKIYNYFKEKMGGVDKRLGLCDTTLVSFWRGMLPRRKRWDVGLRVRRVHNYGRASRSCAVMGGVAVPSWPTVRSCSGRPCSTPIRLTAPCWPRPTWTCRR